MRSFWRYLFREWFRQVGEALLLAFLVTTFLFTTVGVVGSSMNPTLLNGERVFVPKYETWLVRFGLMQWRRGEVAIVKPPEGTPNAYARFPVLGFPFRAFFIKRIVAVPGDTVSYREGQLYVNGQAVNERHITDFLEFDPKSSLYTSDYNYPRVCLREGQITSISTQSRYQISPADIERDPDYAYLKNTLRMLVPPGEEEKARSRGQEYCYTGALKLEPGYYFVMGDNRTPGGSEDGRTFGPIPATSIAGRANFVWWPPVIQGKLRWRTLPVPEGFRNLR
jgi:signal peptidase I